jgi:hypothetical protein
MWEWRGMLDRAVFTADAQVTAATSRGRFDDVALPSDPGRGLLTSQTVLIVENARKEPLLSPREAAS